MPKEANGSKLAHQTGESDATPFISLVERKAVVWYKGKNLEEHWEGFPHDGLRHFDGMSNIHSTHVLIPIPSLPSVPFDR